MSLSLIPIKNPKSLCPVCLEDFTKNPSDGVTHEKRFPDEEDHALHIECFKQWIEVRRMFLEYPDIIPCILCQKNVNIAPLFPPIPWTEKVKSEAKKMFAGAAIFAQISAPLIGGTLALNNIEALAAAQNSFAIQAIGRAIVSGATGIMIGKTIDNNQEFLKYNQRTACVAALFLVAVEISILWNQTQIEDNPLLWIVGAPICIGVLAVSISQIFQHIHNH